MMLAVDRQMSHAQAGSDTATFGAELEALLQPLLDRNYVAPALLDEQEALQISPEGERTIAQLWNVVEQWLGPRIRGGRHNRELIGVIVDILHKQQLTFGKSMLQGEALPQPVYEGIIAFCKSVQHEIPDHQSAARLIQWP
jgi:hypothetical protein